MADHGGPLAGASVIKARLSRGMKPKLTLPNGDVIELGYSDHDIKDRNAPFVPEKVTIRIVPRLMKDRKRYELATLFGLREIGLVATGKSMGERRFRLGDETVRRMHDLERMPGPYPEPNSAPLLSIDIEKDGVSSMTFTINSIITFQGLDPDGEVIRYALRFE